MKTHRGWTIGLAAVALGVVGIRAGALLGTQLTRAEKTELVASLRAL